jgi:enoyl-CoA hydratase/carnithine racemase
LSDPILYEQSEGIATLTINRPETRNAITDPDIIAGLIAAMERINADRSVRVVILTGAGTAFSSGGNLKAIRERAAGSGAEAVNTRYFYRDGIQKMALALHGVEVPLIAAVNGPAIGAGNDLACLCDIRIAADTAVFAESFVRLGIIAGDGGAWLLPRAIGLSRACEMAFTGETIDAQTALDWGLVSRTVPATQLMEAARDLARRIAANPGYALRMTKRLIKEGQHTRLDTLLELSAGLQSLAHLSADHREALDALLEKRKPRFNT